MTSRQNKDNAETKRKKRKQSKAGGDDTAPTSAAAKLVVGIGASAGGLESLKRFFTAMPADGGMGFVIILHLTPDRPSMMAELLGRYTSMPVKPAEDGGAVEPDHVYVIPPGTLLSVSAGRIRVRKPASERERRMPIDAFFRSLAEDQGPNGVCIVLSGAGSDGTLGLRAVKEHGGLALAEALGPERKDLAPFGGMPHSAVATGLVDFEAPAEEMPRHLMDYARHLGEVTHSKGTDGLQNDAAAHLQDICAVLLARKGHDFRHYKPNTLIRRIHRRMLVTRIGSAAAYLRCLREDGEEVERLFRDLLIGVTSFFRDPEAFDALKEAAIRPLVKSKSNDEGIRIWVPASGTGEEVYSIAILVQEVCGDEELFPRVQIFATDIDDLAIETARSGRYAHSAVAEISSERLKRFFVEEDHDYRLKKELREMCIFSQHDVIKDPPFSRLDLISCRNLLIYLDADLQKRLIPIFHYALAEGGYLFLGASENISHHRHLFATVDRKNRVFRRRTTAGPATLEFPLSPAAGRYAAAPRPVGGAEHAKPNLARRAERLVLNEFGPPYVVVDDNFNILHFSQGTGRYLEPAAGVPRSSIVDMARRGLRVGLRSTLHKAMESGQAVEQRGLTVTSEGGPERIDLAVMPLAEEDEGRLFLVVFRPAAAKTDAEEPGAKAASAASDEPEVQRLERELAMTKEDHQTTVEELETSTEELQSANEELLSMNEELQSSNEELETSKEELQSLNEELETVNQELNHKVTELDQINADLRNLLASTQLATIFLDARGCIKWFTADARGIFSLIEADVGRPITDISTKLDYGDLTDDIDRALKTQQTIERQVHLPDEPTSYAMRVLPYRDSDGKVDGVVLTFTDVSKLYAAQQEARERAKLAQTREAELESLVEIVPVGIAMTRDKAGDTVRVNRHGAELLGTGRDVISDGVRKVGYRIYCGHSVVPVEELPLQKALSSGETIEDFEARIVREDGSARDVLISAAPLFDPDGEVSGGITAFADVTDLEEAQRRQKLLVAALQHRVRNILATVRSLLNQTLRSSISLDDFAEHFEGRLDALALTESMMARVGGDTLLLYELLMELLPAGVHEQGTVTIEGPRVMMTARAAQTLALVINELTTNAIKYGGLSDADGRVEITWSVEPGGEGERFRFRWRESGIDASGPPEARGFGLDLIERGLPYELGGTASVTFGQGELACEIDIPAAEHVVEVLPEPASREEGAR